MLIVGQERDPAVDIDHDRRVAVLTFSANGEYLFSGSTRGVQMWRVEDGKQMARMHTTSKTEWDCDVISLAVSKDGKWTAAGTDDRRMFVWEANTCEEVHSQDWGRFYCVDFSPDSTRLVYGSHEVFVWDIATRKQVQTLLHHHGYGGYIVAAKYSPQGDRIATSNRDSIRVWDSDDGRLLVEIDTQVIPYSNDGFRWCNDCLFVVSSSKIEQIITSTGLTISQWQVPDVGQGSCIALPEHGDFIAYFSGWGAGVTLWDTSTHTQLSIVPHPGYIHSIALSPDARFLAIEYKDTNDFNDKGWKIAIKNLSRMAVSIHLIRLQWHLSNSL